MARGEFGGAVVVEAGVEVEGGEWEGGAHLEGTGETVGVDS